MNQRITDRQSLNAALTQLLALDPTLPPPKAPLPLRLRPANFEGLADIIVAQLISRAAAQAIMTRLRTVVQPFTAKTWLATDISQCGLSRAKRNTLDGLASTIESGALNPAALVEHSADEAISALMSHKGIGPWTAHVFCLFCAGHTDTFPAGDVALRAALADVLNLPERPTVKQAEQIAQRWRPLRGVAARLLYAHYAHMKGGSATPL